MVQDIPTTGIMLLKTSFVLEYGACHQDQSILLRRIIRYLEQYRLIQVSVVDT
jgi:hypothetical protein